MTTAGKLRDWRSHKALIAQILSLLATAWFVWQFRLSPRSGGRPLGDAFGIAVVVTIAAWAWCAAIALALNFAIRRVERVDVVGATLRTSAVAVWFAPATMLLSSFSAWGMPAALVLVVTATRLLYSQWQLDYPDEPTAPVLVGQPAGQLGIGYLPSPGLPRHLGPALVVATAFQSGLAAELLRHYLLAAALFVLSTSILTVFGISAGVWNSQRQPSFPRSVFGLLLTLILAAALGVIGVTGGSGSGFGLGSGDGSIADLFKKGKPGGPDLQAVKKAPPPAEAKGGNGPGAPPPPRPPQTRTGDLGGSFPGVILWPEIRPVTLIVPPLPSMGSGYATPSHPLGIPFGGEYWMYRWLAFKRPPPNSFFERGSPSNLSFSTTDRWPLQMEAHQKLEQSIDPACCGKIQIEILNADRYPGTVSLELILISNEYSISASQSLGQAPVLSTPNLKADPIVPVPETLEYVVPPAGGLKQFNEFQVAFRRARQRADKSARISIERFVLVPR